MMAYEITIPIPIGSMGLVYLPTFGLDFYGKLVGKYIIIPYMDPMVFTFF